MVFRIFNPEHDIALAANLSNFTPPHAARQLRRDLGFLPALWAEEDDVVMVDDVEAARRAWDHCTRAIGRVGKAYRGTESAAMILPSKCRFETLKMSFQELGSAAFDPWGWDMALKAALLRNGCAQRWLPSDSQLEAWRGLSHRRVAARLLSQLCMEGVVGESFECHDTAEVARLLAHYGHVVLKAPWSSSGRGVRFVDATMAYTSASLTGWMRHVIAEQGSVMVEPYYNKVKDFGMEFTCLADGSVRYDGLSLFDTQNGAYTGNIIANENRKRKIISRYITVTLLDEVKESLLRLLTEEMGSAYAGPLGIDMMVVARDDANGFLLHPCVEINLRRTMGHVALALNRLCNPQNDDDVLRVMRIEFADNNYKLRILRQ